MDGLSATPSVKPTPAPCVKPIPTPHERPISASIFTARTCHQKLAKGCADGCIPRSSVRGRSNGNANVKYTNFRIGNFILNCMSHRTKKKAMVRKLELHHSNLGSSQLNNFQRQKIDDILNELSISYHYRRPEYYTKYESGCTVQHIKFISVHINYCRKFNILKEIGCCQHQKQKKVCLH